MAYEATITDPLNVGAPLGNRQPTIAQRAGLVEIVEGALELNPDQLAFYLARTCGADVNLRQRVEKLLEADRNAGRFLARPAVADWAQGLFDPPNTEAYSGQRIGPYRIVRPLGSGGIGEVFLAARADHQYEQQVAVKVLKHRLGGDEAKLRILAERQILARLEHPNIARLYDGGTTEDGRPYLVMEYIDGLPMDTYCVRNALSLEKRLEFFAALCSAVQFAHQNFVVHRDLKPGNILVTHDGTLKLLDFSIAKALSGGHELLGAETATGNSPMTLAYASPEQIRCEPITTATDVHGLGIMLYRTLTGRHPFVTEGRPVHEVAKMVCGDDPVPPSRATTAAASSASADAIATVSTDATTADVKIAGSAAVETAIETAIETVVETLPVSRLQGDLDAIILKALAKRAEDRYPSAEQLAADIDRHQRQLPILARPPSLEYRLRKAVSRHRSMILLASLAGLLILASVLALVRQTRRANTAAARANMQAQQAQRQANSAEEVADFLTRIIGFKPGFVTAEEILGVGRENARIYFKQRPESQARVLEAIGVAYHHMGLYDVASETLDEALQTRSQVHGPYSREFTIALLNQARLKTTTGDYDAAGEILKKALAIVRSAPEPDPIGIASCLHLQGNVDLNQERFVDAERHIREAYRIRRAQYGDLHSDVISTQHNLALALDGQDRFEEAETLLLESIAARDELHGPGNANSAIGIFNLAEIYRARGRVEESETLYLQTLQTSQAKLGKEHPTVGHIWVGLGSLYVDLGRLDSAAKALDNAHRIVSANFDPQHRLAVELEEATAELRSRQEHPKEAEALTRRGQANG